MPESRTFSPVNGGDYGQWNGALTDFAAELRFMAVNRRYAVTPFVGIVIPTHHYETDGHSAIGRDLREYQVGLNVGWHVGEIIPNLILNLNLTGILGLNWALLILRLELR